MLLVINDPISNDNYNVRYVYQSCTLFPVSKEIISFSKYHFVIKMTRNFANYVCQDVHGYIDQREMSTLCQCITLFKYCLMILYLLLVCSYMLLVLAKTQAQRGGSLHCLYIWNEKFTKIEKFLRNSDINNKDKDLFHGYFF